MKRKKLGIALGALLCAIAGAGGIWAFAAAETSVTNRPVSYTHLTLPTT